MGLGGTRIDLEGIRETYGEAAMQSCEGPWHSMLGKGITSAKALAGGPQHVQGTKRRPGGPQDDWAFMTGMGLIFIQNWGQEWNGKQETLERMRD